MGIIDYLIVVGIVVLILAVYRQLDRNNRSMEKVKRLGDRCMQDLEAVTQEKLVQLKDIAIESEVHQEASRKAIEHLRQAEEGLDAKARFLDELQQRIGGYDAALGELIGMTQKAEENIGRLRDESAYIDKVGRRIRQAAGQLQELQNRVPGLLSEFGAANDAALKATVEKLLGTVEERHGTLEKRVEDADRQSAERIHRMQNLLHEVEDDLSRRVDVYRAAFDAIEAEYGQRLDQVAQRGVRLETEALGRLGESIQQHMDEKHRALRVDIEAMGEHLRMEEAGLDERMEALRARGDGYEQEMSRYLDEMTRKIASRMEGHDQSFESARMLQDRRLEDLAGQMESRIEAVRSDAESRVGRVHEALEGLVDSARADVAREHEEFRQELSGWQRDLEDLYRQVESGMKDKAEAHESVFRQALDRIDNSLEATGVEMSARVEAAMESHTRTLEDFQASLAGRLEQMEGQVWENDQEMVRRLQESQEKGQTLAEALLGRISNDVDAKTASMREAIESRVEDVSNRVRASHDQIDTSFNELRTRVDGWIHDSRSYMDTLETRLQDLNASSQKASTEQRETLDAYIADTRERLDSWGHQLETRVAGLDAHIARAEDLVQDEFRRLTEEAGTLAEKTGSEMHEIFRDARSAIAAETLSRIEAFRVEVAGEAAGLEEEYRNIRNRMESWEQEGIRQQQQYQDAWNLREGEFRDSMEERLRALDARMDTHRTESEARLDNRMEAHRVALEGLLDKAGERQAELQDLETGLSEANASLRQLVESMEKSLRDAVTSVATDADREREGLKDGFDQSLSMVRQHMDEAMGTLSRNASEQMEELLGRIKESGEEFHSTLDLWRQGLSSRVEELDGLSRGLHRDTIGQVQKQIHDVQAQAQDIYARIQADLKKEMGEQEEVIRQLLGSNETDLKRLMALGKDTQERLANWQDMVGAQTARLEGDLEAIRTQALEQAGEGIGQMRRKLQEQQDLALQDLNEGLNRLRSEIHHSRNDVEQDVRFLGQQIEQWKGTYQEQLKALEVQSKSIGDEAFQGLKDRIAALREEARGLTRSVQDEFAKSTQEAQVQVARQAESYQAELRKIAQIRSDMEGRIQELAQEMARVRNQGKTGMESLAAENERMWKDARDRLAAEALARLQALQDEGRKNWELGISGLEEQKSHHDRETQRIQQALEQSRAEMMEKLKSLQGETANLRRDAMTGIQERIDSLRDDARKLTGQVKNEIVGLVGEHQSQVERQLKETEDEFHRIQDLNSTAQLRFQEIQDIFNRAEQMAMKEYDGLREKTREMVETNTEELRKELGSSRKAFQDLVNQHVGDFSESVGGARTEMQKELQLLQGEFTHYRGELDSRMKLLGAEVKKAQDDWSATLRSDLEKVRVQGENLSRGMQEQVLKSLEVQRQEITRLVHDGGDVLEQAKAFGDQTQEVMDGIRISVQQKVSALEASIKTYSEDTSRRIQQASEEYQQRIIGDVEKRLRDYEQEISYRIGKIETVNDDIDNLESNMRKSMERLGQKLREDVERMGQEFKGRHQSDVELVRKDMDGVNLQIIGLEKELNELKTRAYDNVSQQLQIFEDEFFVDLRNRSQRMDQKIGDWKAQVEGTLEAISVKEKEERQVLEETYSNLMKTRLLEMEANFKTRLQKAGSDFDAFQESISQRLQASEQGIHEMQSELRTEVQGLQANTLENVQREFVRMGQDLENRIRAYERDVESRLQKGDQEIRMKQSDMVTIMDGVRNDVSLWQTQVLNQIRSSGDGVQEELAAFRQQTEIALNDMQNGYAREKDELSATFGLERNQLRKEIGDLGERVQRFGLDFDQRTRETIETFQRNHQAFLSDMENENRGLREEVTEQVGSFREYVATSRNDFETMQRKAMSRLDEELRNVDASLKDMDKRIKAFVAQTRLFERADVLKDTLSEQMEKMRSEIQQIEEQRKGVLDLDSYLGKVRKMAEEANEKVGRLTAEKRRLDSLDEDYKKLISISNVVDQKIAQVTASNDTLTEIQLALRHLEEVQKDVSAKYDRLERKSDVIDATAEGIERSFGQLQEMEGRIQGVQTLVRDLPGQVTDLSERVRTLLTHKKDAESALKSVSSLDKTLKDVENRIGELNTTREWIARTETRLTELTREADEKVGLLSALVKKDMVAEKSGPIPGGPSQSVREVVLKLAQQGWRAEEIARTTKLSRGEVELILEMRSRQ